ncbi:MAG: amidohydrolase [Sutterellaceae bacterium]|nr:amidohydrolase [Sutterellaceae bacterium]
MTCACAYKDQLINIRRQLHTNPEEGWSEFTTNAFIVNTLRGYGYEVLLGKKVVNPDFCLGRDMKVVQAGIERARKNGVSEDLLTEMEELTGCVAVLDTGRPGPTLAIRFDIDCVPVNECTDDSHLPAKEGFISKNPGLMHACGHDAHMSMGLAVAHWVMDNKDQLNGKIKIVFQPAEEGVRGAAGVAASGIVDDADYFLASHVAMSAKSGEIATNLYGFLCTTKFDVTFNGKPAHAGACPQDGRNALAAAANATVQMLGISRHSEGMTRINVGQLIAGEGRNVIPSKAVLKLEVRGETADINNYMAQQVENICQGISIGFGVSYECRKMGEAVDLNADQELVDILNKCGHEVEGLTVVDKPLNFGGSEDATILARRVQEHGGKAAFFLWGSDRPSGHHTATFDVKESDFVKSLELWTKVIPTIMK